MVINPLQTILLVVIILLAGYIIYLQLLLVRKNNLVESIVSKLANLEKSLDVEEIKRFLNEIRSLTVRPALHEDKLFDDSIINFILGQDRDSKIFIHYTRDENDAKNIHIWRAKNFPREIAWLFSGDRLSDLQTVRGKDAGQRDGLGIQSAVCQTSQRLFQPGESY